MINEIKKIAVFVRRDFRMLFTYKLAFFMSFLSIVFNLFYLVLFGSMFGTLRSDIAMQIGSNQDFISYILIGSMGWGFLWTVVNSTGFSLKTEMMMGTLESILATPTKIMTMIIAYTLFGCFFGFISFILLFFIGYIFFGIAAFASANIFTIIVFVLSIIMMMGFGLIFSGLTIWLKNIGETIPLFQGLSLFFSGVYFPISILPIYLQPVAKYVPFYYSMQGLRISLRTTSLTSELANNIIILFILAIIFLIIGYLILRYGLIKSRKEGSLSYY